MRSFFVPNSNRFFKKNEICLAGADVPDEPVASPEEPSAGMAFLRKMSISSLRSGSAGQITVAPSMRLSFNSSAMCENYARLLVDLTREGFDGRIHDGFARLERGFPLRRQQRCWFLLTSHNVIFFEKPNASPTGEKSNTALVNNFF